MPQKLPDATRRFIQMSINSFPNSKISAANIRQIAQNAKTVTGHGSVGSVYNMIRCNNSVQNNTKNVTKRKKKNIKIQNIRKYDVYINKQGYNYIVRVNENDQPVSSKSFQTEKDAVQAVKLLREVSKPNTVSMKSRAYK